MAFLRSSIITSLFVLFALISVGQSRAAPPDLFTSPVVSNAANFDWQADFDAQAEATVIGKEYVGINFDLLAKPAELTGAALDGATLDNEIVIRIFSSYHDVDFDVVLNRFEASGDGSGVTWFGYVQGMNHSDVHIVVRGETVSGNIRLGDDRFYQIRDAAYGNHAFLSIDPTRFYPDTHLDIAEYRPELGRDR